MNFNFTVSWFTVDGSHVHQQYLLRPRKVKHGGIKRRYTCIGTQRYVKRHIPLVADRN